jgi:mannan endo-1,4-beta-mannosidase
MRRRLPAVLLALAVLLPLAAACSASAAASPPGFVGHDGTVLTVDGVPTPLVGINVYNATSNGNCWYDARSTFAGALERVRTETGGRANVVRVWFFQRLATKDGARDWTEFDRVLRTAHEEGFRVIPVLTDQWGACESSNTYKDVAWYRSGYRAAGPDLVPYRDWVREVTTRYRADPTVALWSLVNEAEAGTAKNARCPDGAGAALEAFAADASAVAKAADPNHLVGLGTIGGSQCGVAGDQYSRLHDIPTIDVCEYHDYDPEPLPGTGENSLQSRLAACAALGRPLFVGELGADGDEVGGVDARAALFRAKIEAQVPAGIAGLLLWGWSDRGFGVDDEYGIGPSDPALPVLGDYPLPGLPG